MSRHSRATLLAAVAISAGAATGCVRKEPCPRCDTLVIAAVGEPSSVLPPAVLETVGRDIGDLVFERLASLAPGGAPIDTGAYRPGLAASWERLDSLTLRFHLRPGARWHDGRAVSASDVVFSFETLADSALDAPARAVMSGAIRATAEDSATVRVAFARAYPEQLFDATWHVRVIPEHVWGSIPVTEWAADTSVARLVGSGPYRVANWERGASLRLEAVAPAHPAPGGAADGGSSAAGPIRAVVWRFTTDPDAALNLVLAHEADLLETLGTPERAARVAADSALRTVSYPSAVYGFLGYNVVRGPRSLRDRAVRRGLNLAVDRATIANAVVGAGAKAPPGPMSQLIWIWDDSVAVLPYDTVAAGRALDAAGWPRGPDGMRRRGGTPLAFDIMVPATSVTRRRLAESLQESWRLAGVAVTITSVDFPVFQERLGQGKFETYIGAWLDEPSPRSLADQWTSAGIGVLNYGGYTNQGFDRAFASALAAVSLPDARAKWRAALDTLNADAPALFLYAPVASAAVSNRVQRLSIDPWSWLGELPAWRLSKP